MQSDSWIGSVIWGRIGGAVLLLLAFILQAFGFDISPEDQQQTFGTIQTILASLGSLFIIFSKYREKMKEKKSSGESGFTEISILVILFALSMVAMTFFSGCAPNQTATQQISRQTSDPMAIAKAAYIDASDVYINAAASYSSHKKMLEQSNPDLAKQIKEKFSDANGILDKWRSMISIGVPINGDTSTFKNLRLMVIQAIAEMEARK